MLAKMYLKVQGWQMVPKGPRLAKGNLRSSLLVGEQTHRNADKQTDTHINTMTWTGLGAGPSENTSMMKNYMIFCNQIGMLTTLYFL